MRRTGFFLDSQPGSVPSVSSATSRPWPTSPCDDPPSWTKLAIRFDVAKAVLSDTAAAPLLLFPLSGRTRVHSETHVLYLDFVCPYHASRRPAQSGRAVCIARAAQLSLHFGFGKKYQTDRTTRFALTCCCTPNTFKALIRRLTGMEANASCLYATPDRAARGPAAHRTAHRSHGKRSTGHRTRTHARRRPTPHDTSWRGPRRPQPRRPQPHGPHGTRPPQSRTTRRQLLLVTSPWCRERDSAPLPSTDSSPREFCAAPDPLALDWRGPAPPAPTA